MVTLFLRGHPDSLLVAQQMLTEPCHRYRVPQGTMITLFPHHHFRGMARMAAPYLPLLVDRRSLSLHLPIGDQENSHHATSRWSLLGVNPTVALPLPRMLLLLACHLR